MQTKLSPQENKATKLVQVNFHSKNQLGGGT